MAGKLMRQEIGRYSKQRSEELKNFTYVGDIYSKAQTLQENEFKLQHQGEDFSSKMDARKAALNASNLAAKLSGFRLSQDQQKAQQAKDLAAAIQQNPELATDPVALMKAAGGNLPLVKAALDIYTGVHTLPDASGLTPGQRIPMQAAQGADIAQAYGADAIAQAQRDAEAAKLEAANARADAQKALERQQQLTDRGSTLEQDLAKEARGRVEDLYKPRLAGLTNDFLGQSRIEKAEEMNQEKARVIGFLESGGLSRNDAYAIASGDYSALATPIDQPTPAPTVTPAPTATPTPRPTGAAPVEIRSKSSKS
jgi:hypothetical protein